MATKTTLDVEVHNTLSLAVSQAQSTALLLAQCADMQGTTQDAFEGIVTLLQPAVDLLQEAAS